MSTAKAATTTSTTDRFANVPLPAGVVCADDWQGNPSSRVLLGATRHISGTDLTVESSAIQFSDGSIDDGRAHEPPSVYVGDRRLSCQQARDLVAAVIEAADEAERWVQSMLAEAR